MKPLSELGPAGQTARLRRMALRALAHYDLDVAMIRPLATHFNTIFRIHAAGRPRFVLRINRPRHRTRADIFSELTWLDALRRETGLIVTGPVPIREGAFVTTVEAPGIPEPRHCSLFRWVDGRSQFRKAKPQSVFTMGTTLARLHDHADRFTPPAGSTERELNRVWPFGRPAALDHDEPDDLLTPERRPILHEIATRVEAALTDLSADPSGLRFHHADLHLGNVSRSRRPRLRRQSLVLPGPGRRHLPLLPPVLPQRTGTPRNVHPSLYESPALAGDRHGTGRYLLRRPPA